MSPDSPNISPSAIIHPTANVDASAIIGPNVTVGPNAFIGPAVTVGEGSTIAPYAVLLRNTRLGKNNHIATGAVIGGDPQHLNLCKEATWVELHDNVTVREFATINRANTPNAATLVGTGSLIMAYAHIGHDCVLGQEVVLANQVQLGGHVEIGDYTMLGGRVLVHQFCKIGRMSMVAVGAIAMQDIPPFALTAQSPAMVYGINAVGMKRRGVPLATRTTLKTLYLRLIQEQGNRSQIISEIEAEYAAKNEAPDAFVAELLAFIKTAKRGIRFRPSKRTDQRDEVVEADIIPDSLFF